MKINLTPSNNKGQPHGYWEKYWLNANIWYKGNFINGKKYGLWERYLPNGNLFYKKYFIL